MIGSDLTEKARVKLCNLLQRSLDIFAWTPADMTGVPRHIAEHRLNVREGCQPVRQKKRGQAAERNIAINDEVSKLVAAGIMREVHYHDWLSNPVMVKKSDNSWRMCVDFKDLNKACPKDGYPLPEIDWKVESLCGFPFKCFLDAYKGYHQIQMAEEDEEKTANLEVHVDDLVIKRRTGDEVVRDIEETFKTLRKINMKLNPKKCTFGVEEGMFLGYQVNTKGIKICPDKVDAVLSLQSLKFLKDVQKLNGKLASLNRFLAKSVEKSLPFFKTLKKCTKKSDFLWTEEAESAFRQMKEHIAKLPMLTAPEEQEELIVYLAASKEAVSVVLMTEKRTMGQVLADFIVERPEEEGVILTNPEGVEFTYALRFQFEATNNEAEYEALIAGLRIAEKKLQTPSKCRLKTGSKPSKWDLHRKRNRHDQILREGKNTGHFAHLSKQVLVEELKEKSVNESEVLAVVEEEGESWMTPIHEYLTDETLPAERKKARAIKRKSQRFAIINGILYKKSFLGPWLRCVGPSQANYVLREIHEGSCSMHAGTRSVVAKALRIGYYWPTMHKDARALIKACQECQVHKPVPRNPQEKLNPITSPWPFYKWGIDIAGPFPEGPGKVKFLIVAMDYFTKWIEAKPVATITGNQVKKFVWENIMCRFGLPGEIISDNGKQFRDNPFKDWCEKLCIQQHFASVKHPQTNGLVERANRSLGEGIKARLGKDNKNWMEEISHVLWAHRTMVKSSNGDTPFSLTYGTEVVIPAEIGMPTFRIAEVDMAKNDEALKINLELLEEKREQAAIKEAKSKRQMEKYYNTRVRNTSFKPGDLVYRNNEASRAEDTGKLGPKWEGPYEVTEALGKGSYRLKDRHGKELPRTWNVCNLKKCYIHKM
ncbi:reverse transcriptase domain-containing protein [Tanacetum coccineum]